VLIQILQKANYSISSQQRLGFQSLGTNRIEFIPFSTLLDGEDLPPNSWSVWKKENNGLWEYLAEAIFYKIPCFEYG